MKAHLVPLVTAILVAGVAGRNDACNQTEESMPLSHGFKVADGYKSLEKFTTWGHYGSLKPHIEGKWDPTGKVLTFKAKLGGGLTTTDEASGFVVHLTNGRSLGKTNTDFNCRIDSGYDDECPMVKLEPWCCYSSATFDDGKGFKLPLKCSGKQCRKLKPIARCRARCMDHLMYHILFDTNTVSGGGEVKVIVSYRYKYYFQTDEPLIGDQFPEEDTQSYNPHIKFITLASSLGSPVNSEVETGLWLQLIEQELDLGHLGKEKSSWLRIGRSGQKNGIVEDINLSEIKLEEIIHQQSDPGQHVHSYGYEVRNKTDVFHPEFFATDTTPNTGIVVSYDCPDVMHTPLLQSSRKGDECIDTYQCPYGKECKTDDTFAGHYPELAWMNKKSCRAKVESWKDIVGVLIFGLGTILLMISCTIPFLVWDRRRINTARGVDKEDEEKLEVREEGLEGQYATRASEPEERNEVGDPNVK